MKKNDQRAKKINEAIRLVWLSIESHLEPTFLPLTKQDRERGENKEFHKKCVEEYALLIKLLSELF